MEDFKSALGTIFPNDTQDVFAIVVAGFTFSKPEDVSFKYYS